MDPILPLADNGESQLLASAPSITLESLTFSDGTVIALEPTDMVLFVGPNNAGKSAAYQQLQDLCKAIGLWIVPVGELEGFCRSEGNKGPRWVQNVLEKYDLRTADELEEARAFVRRVWNRISP